MIALVPRWSAVIAATIVLLGTAVARAGAAVPAEYPATAVHFFAADATEAGVINLFFFGARGQRVAYFERVGGRLEPLGTRTAPADEPTEMAEAVTWRCDRLVRRFAAIALLPDGTLATGAYSVRTPSCRTRFELGVPRRLAAGGLARIRVVDRWGNGGASPRLCVTPPRGDRECERLRLRRAVAVRTRRVRVSTSGRWRVELRFRGHRVRRSIAVGEEAGGSAPPPTVLATGDSTMQGVDSFLADELGGAATVRSDVRPGTGIAKPDGPWATLPARQAKGLRPAATVVSLGVVDGFPIRSRDGTTHACCDPGWVAEYGRRVREMMLTYRRRGRGRVVWLTLPIPRGRREATDAVNLAVVRAAEGLERVTVLRIDRFFSPDGFREVMRYRGRDVRVRERDGIHLNIAGTAIAAKLVAAALRRR